MTSSNTIYIFPQRFRCLSGSTLKIIAGICMLIDHIGAFLLRHMAEGYQTLPGTTLTYYQLSRDIGRIAFPIYCFLIVEGFLHTRSRFKYGRNLLLFALISKLPWNYVHSGTLLYNTQNVFFTLFLGYLGICALEYFKETPIIAAGITLLLLYISTRLTADYRWYGYGLILLLYALRENQPAQTVTSIALLSFEWKAMFAFLPINLYNRERGFIRRKSFKYLFYAFYPIHLLILGYIKYH